jgi:tRNA A-37 threonylcarbamoyl transferase component Bud32
MRECPECRNAVEDAARFCPYCGAASAAAATGVDPWIGRIVNGKFRIDALVGQGGMGRVYRARHLTLDRPVVLKVLHREFSSDPQVMQRFQREARAASRLDHPNSIAVLDFGESEDGTLFMAMELLGGRDLAKVVAEEFPLGEARIARIGAQILSALAEAHAQGIVHRDLKPENVMVEPRRGEPDFVKVLDFGIAKIAAPGANDPKLTQAGLVCGTPEYMSPEQARGAELDARTDLYSMGVILYQLATGELPFQSDTPVGFLTKHLAEAPVPARQRCGGVSEALEAVISKAMEKDPARRFQTADEMRAALLAVEPAPAIAAAPARSRLLFWVFAGAVVVAAAGGGAVTFFARQSVAARKGHPDTISPAQTEAANPATTAASTATATPTPSPTPTPTATPSPTPTATSTSTATTAKRTPAAAPRRDRAKALALFRKGEARRAGQDVDGAIQLYLAAEAADPGLAEVQKKLGLCYQLKGDTRRAAERYRRYLATSPADAERVRAVLSTLE